MEINHWVILGCAVLAMVAGGLWYGPLFGKQWMAIIGLSADCSGDGNGKKMLPLYLVQFLLVIFQLYVLAYVVTAGKYTFGMSSVAASLWIWAGFILPTLAGSSMWTADSASVKWSRFLIQTGYQFVVAAIFGFILGL